MRSQKCTNCGTLLDVSKLEKGSKFACATCGSILVVGEAVAVKKSLRDAGPAFKPKGSAADAPATPHRTRRATGEDRATQRPARTRTPREPGEKKSNLVLFAGIGLVVIVGAIVAVVLSMGGPEESGTGGGGGGGRPKQTAQQWWASVAGEIDGLPAMRLHALIQEARERGYSSDASFWKPKEDRIFELLLQKSPDDEVANRHFGRKSLTEYPGFSALWERMNEYYKVLPDNFRNFLTTYEARVGAGGNIWVTAEEFAAAKATLDSFGPWVEQLEADPSIEQIDRGRVQAAQMIKGEEAVAVVSRPFILFLGSQELANPDVSEDAKAQLRGKLESLGAKYAKGLEVFLKAYDEHVRTPLGLGPVPVEKVFYQWLYETRAHFEEALARGEGFEVLGDVNGLFSPRSRWAYVLRDTEGEAARAVLNDVAHEGVHQLHQYYAQDPDDKYENLYDRWQGLWFTEGWAEYLGGGLHFDPSTGATTWDGIADRRLDHLQLLRDNGMPRIPLRELVQQDTFRLLQSWIGNWMARIASDDTVPESALALQNQQGAGVHIRSFYAQSWFLIYFLNEYEGGKYRAKYNDLVFTVLRGKQKPEAYRDDKTVKERWRNAFDAFRAIMGIDSEEGWDRLQKEYDAFLKKVLREKRG